MYTTLAFTGTRIGELRQLRWEHVNVDQNIIRITSGNAKSGAAERGNTLHSVASS